MHLIGPNFLPKKKKISEPIFIWLGFTLFSIVDKKALWNSLVTSPSFGSFAHLRNVIGQDSDLRNQTTGYIQLFYLISLLVYTIYGNMKLYHIWYWILEPFLSFRASLAFFWGWWRDGQRPGHSKLGKSSDIVSARVNFMLFNTTDRDEKQHLCTIFIWYLLPIMKLGFNDV